MSMTRNIARTIAIVYAALITVFALLSGAGNGFMELLLNVPNAVPWLLVWLAVAIAWRYPRTGGWVFILLSAAATIFFHAYAAVMSFGIITVPLLIIGILFLLSDRPERYPSQLS